jgi:hypothetical protein
VAFDPKSHFYAVRRVTDSLVSGRLEIMLNQFRAIGRAITTSRVLVMISTVVTLIIVISPFASVRWRITWTVCLVIAILGLITIFRELRRQYRFDMARQAINALYVEGRTITDEVENTCDKTPKGEQMIADWCARVDDALRKHLKEELYVKRFHQGGSNMARPGEMTVFKNNFRLETLATFLQELRP